jgi:hypothetical protein
MADLSRVWSLSQSEDHQNHDRVATCRNICEPLENSQQLPRIFADVGRVLAKDIPPTDYSHAGERGFVFVFFCLVTPSDSGD